MKAMIVFATLTALFFGWSAITAFDKVEAAWKAQDSRIEAQLKAAGA